MAKTGILPLVNTNLDPYFFLKKSKTEPPKLIFEPDDQFKITLSLSDLKVNMFNYKMIAANKYSIVVLYVEITFVKVDL